MNNKKKQRLGSKGKLTRSRPLSRARYVAPSGKEFRGRIFGYVSDEIWFSGSTECFVNDDNICMKFFDNDGNNYECNMARLPVINSNSYSGKWQCDDRSGEIKGRLVPDFDDWIFIGIFVEDYPFKIYVELHR